jgi:hypothetical protein
MAGSRVHWSEGTDEPTQGPAVPILAMAVIFAGLILLVKLFM